MKTTKALVVLCLIQGSLANDRLGLNDQKYYKDSISPGIDPSSYTSSQIDYSDLPPSLDPTSNSHSLPYPKASNNFTFPLAPAQHDYSHSDSHSIESSAFVNSDHDSPFSQHFQHIRSARNADDQLTDYLKHTTIVAHLVNGIAIQNGLMNGKMTSNDVAAELLNFGSISISTIANFKKDSIVAVTGQLKKPQPILDSSITEMEELALKWERLISKSSGLENATSLPGNDKYFNEVEKFKKEFETTVVSLPTFNVVDSDFTGIKARLDDNAKYDEIYNSFATFSRDFTKKLEDFDKYRKDIEDFTKYPLLQEGPKLFEPLDRLIALTDFRLTFSLELDENMQIISKSVEKVLSLATIYQAAKNKFLDIHKFVESRASSGLTNRKHTIGFSGGINDVNQLLNDVRDPWIRRMLNVQKSNVNWLTDGLEPLFEFRRRLSIVNEKLQPISTTDKIYALLNFAMFQQELSSMEPDAAQSVSTLVESLRSCGELHIYRNEYESSKNLTENIKILGSVYDSARLALDVFDSKTVREEMNQLFESLGFKDFRKNNQNARIELEEAVKRLEKHNTLDDMKKLVNRIKQRIARIPVMGLGNITQYIIDNQKDITFNGIDNRVMFYSCISKLAADSTKASRGIKAVRSLRALKLGEIAEVESAAELAVRVSSELSDIESISVIMREEAKEIAVELNKFPDAEQMSQFIGKSVLVLQNVIKLKDLESRIDQLKTMDEVFRVEMWTVFAESDRLRISNQWGNHKKDMDELENALAAINSYVRQLNEADLRQLSDYGSFLNRLTKIPSVNMDAKEKFKALEALKTSADPTNKPIIEESQKTLKQLENLDLRFEKHHGPLRNAPRAFKAFQSFMMEFVAKKTVPTQTDSSDKGIAIKYVIIAASICLLALVIGIIGTLHLVKKRKELKTEEK